jgi:hypothetical protein
MIPNENKMKRQFYVTLIFLTIALAVISLASGCKKEQPSCGTCEYIEHYSHNDSTFRISGTTFCDEDYERIKNEQHFYSDTIGANEFGIGGVHTDIHSQFNCSK